MDIATALFLLIGSHYIFNLSYHTKVQEVMRFLQEKVMRISSDASTKKSKGHLAASNVHINLAYHTLKDGNEQDKETIYRKLSYNEKFS